MVRFVVRRLVVCAGAALFFAAGCEDEVGGPCSPDAEDVEERLQPTDDENRLGKSVNFVNCSQALCLSVAGSRGFCTIECESDAACPADFRCDTPILTGPLACGDSFDDNGGSCEGVDLENFTRYCTTDREVIETRDGA